MSARTILVAGARVVALVVVTTMVALTMGVMAPGVEMASESTSAGSYQSVGEAPNARDTGRPNPDAPFSGASASGLEMAAVGSPRDTGRSSGAIVETPSAEQISERFSGEGAGRKHAVVARDPYNRRAYILESASLLQRRGWIGLSRDGGTTATGGSGGLRWSEDRHDPE
jgi:hypothetical protein